MNLLSFFRRSPPKAIDTVAVTTDGVLMVRADGRAELMHWDKLYQVDILTTSQGPFGDDVFCLLIGTDGTSICTIPQSSEGFGKLLKRLQQLPDFNNQAFIEAMSSTSDGRYVCWKKNDS